MHPPPPVSPFLSGLTRLAAVYDGPGRESDVAILARAVTMMLPAACHLPHDEYVALCDLAASVTAPEYDTGIGAA